jgi:hypothetical protein
MSTTTKQQCAASTKAGAQCRKFAGENSSLCSLHKGLGAVPKFSNAVLRTCGVKTKAGTPCRNVVNQQGLTCTIHSDAPSAPRKVSGWNIFTSVYNSDMWKMFEGEKNAGACSAIWKEEKGEGTDLYKLCMAGDKDGATALVKALLAEAENSEPGEAGDEDYDPDADASAE